MESKKRKRKYVRKAAIDGFLTFKVSDAMRKQVHLLKDMTGFTISEVLRRSVALAVTYYAEHEKLPMVPVNQRMTTGRRRTYCEPSRDAQEKTDAG